MLDELTMGLEEENLFILGAGNKHGKTTFAVNTVAHNLDEGHTVLVVTTEVSARQYLLRLLARETKTSLRDIRQNKLSDAKKRYLQDELRRLGENPLYVVEAPLCTTEDIGRAIYDVLPDVVVVDHLQRIQWPGDNSALGLKDVSLTLKNYAITQKIPILLLSQLTFEDGWEKREGDKVRYDFTKVRTRWSREPHGEADKLLFLHNLEQTYHEPHFKGRANVILHSMRDYASGDVVPVRTNMEHQWIGDDKEYRARYGGNGNGSGPY